MLSMKSASVGSLVREYTARHRRLLARIHRRGYATTAEIHAVGPLRLSFTRVDYPDDVLDRVVEAEDRREKLTGQRHDGNELHLPYWAELWDSALAVGRQLVHGEELRSSRRSRAGSHAKNRHRMSVLDLGCGMGFAGMVAAAMGARVVLADLEPEALLFARLNALRWADRVRTRRLNWQTDRLRERFDLIIGADVLYDRSQWEYLEPFFRSHLADGGCVLLGEPGRQTGDLFPDWLTSQGGWMLDMLEQKLASRPRPVRIFRLRRR
jgi:predicted nicotinamide N-methyase